MLSLKGRQDGFRLLLPNEFIPEEINEKYTEILKSKHSFITKPIDFINESIQKVQVLGFQNATIQQQQTYRGNQIMNQGIIDRTAENRFLHTSSEYSYRSEMNPLTLLDKTLNIEFRHTLGYLNYFMIFESFWYQYCRDENYENLPKFFNVEILNEKGSIYSKIVLEHPIMDNMDMLDLDYSQPVAQSQTFKVSWKYSNIDFQFIDTENDTNNLY